MPSRIKRLVTALLVGWLGWVCIVSASPAIAAPPVSGGASSFTAVPGVAGTRPLAGGAPLKKLRVQLQWVHQSQFAGFYVAQTRQHFENEGLDVELIEGGPQSNPITALQEGKADIAVSWLNNAWNLSTPENRVTNVAQIFSGSSLVVICRISAGILVPRDLWGKQIGVWELGDQLLVKEMLQRLSIPRQYVEITKQRPDGKDLIDGTLPCVTAMTYNEYWKILAAGVPPTDLLVLSPEAFGIPSVEDGLYVRAERLESAEFQDELARFIRALRRGWQEARIAPTLALETVQRMSPNANREQQQYMLETVLGITADTERFGFFDLGRFQQTVDIMKSHGLIAAEPPLIWTHRVWNRLGQMDKKTVPLTAATKHYADTIMSTTLFTLFLSFGVLTFALNGALEAVNRGYDFWGRLILAFMSGLGGGTIRDLLIGGERLPFFYVSDLTLPLGILILVSLTSLITGLYRDIHKTEIFRNVKVYADIIGFSVLAIAGAKIAISANLHWAWAPICGALTCAGGGMLRDVIVNQEPATFKGVIYEEAAVLGALVFVGGLMISNYFEYTSVPVYLSFAAGILTILLTRVLVHRYNIRYPGFHNGKKSNP